MHVLEEDLTLNDSMKKIGGRAIDVSQITQNLVISSF